MGSHPIKWGLLNIILLIFVLYLVLSQKFTSQYGPVKLTVGAI